jgi:excisionase family DNA binding protein
MILTTEWLSIGQAARKLGLSGQRIRQLIEAGSLRCEMTAYGRLIDPESVTEEIARRQVLITEKG